MKKLKIIFLSISLIASIVIGSAFINATSSNYTVYVCGKSTIYHDASFHAALKRCKSGISKMVESKAINLGKRECNCKDK
jgi:hypothetical protein